MVAPYMFGKLRVVNERVAVTLIGIHGIITVNLLLAHRVFPMPFQQEPHSPVTESRIGIAGKHVGVPSGYTPVIARRHIEV